VRYDIHIYMSLGVKRLITQAEGTSETSLYLYQTVRCHISSDDLYSQPLHHPVSMQNLIISPFNVKDTANVANMTSISQPVIGRAYLNPTARLSVTQRGAKNWPVWNSTGEGVAEKEETTLVR